MSLKVGIVGAAGYAGAELIRLVLGHPEFELAAITSNADAGQPLSAVYPSFAGVSDLVFTTHDAPAAQELRCGLSWPCRTRLPWHRCPRLLAAGVSCIDLSADYRLSDPSVFEAWYAAEHTSPELLKTRAFGLPELFCQDLETAASEPCRRQARFGRLRRLLSHRNEPCRRSCRARGLGGRERSRDRRRH